MARAVAARRVAFFFGHRSSFIELFVGWGFPDAPTSFRGRSGRTSIIFIDEIDAIGSAGAGAPSEPTTSASRRSTRCLRRWMASPSTGGGWSSWRQPNNWRRPSTKRCLRPGRFDRTVEIPLPNQKDGDDPRAPRQEEEHASDVDLEAVCANAGVLRGRSRQSVNEAAIVAIRSGRESSAPTTSRGQGPHHPGRRDARMPCCQREALRCGARGRPRPRAVLSPPPTPFPR